MIVRREREDPNFARVVTRSGSAEVKALNLWRFRAEKLFERRGISRSSSAVEPLTAATGRLARSGMLCVAYIAPC